MEKGQPSKTALAAAYWRAHHQVIDEPRVLEDPLAFRILGIPTADPSAQDPRVTAMLHRFSGGDADQLGRRLFFATRTRFAEQVIADAVADGTRQVVLLGAGLDTFAYRNPHPDVRVFEVDHPDTQAWKRGLLAAGAIPIPDSVTFAPVDFETDVLAERLAAAGFRSAEAAVFVWLGVVFYLTQDAIEDTLGYIAGQGHSVRLILDYLPAAATDHERAVLRERSSRAAITGEPFRSYFAPTGIAELLRSFGFTDIEDHDARELIADYRGVPLPDGALPEPASRILRAERSGPGAASS